MSAAGNSGFDFIDKFNSFKGAIAKKQGGIVRKEGGLNIAWRGGPLKNWSSVAIDAPATKDIGDVVQRAAAFMRQQEPDEGQLFYLDNLSDEPAPVLKGFQPAVKSSAIFSTDLSTVEPPSLPPAVELRRLATPDDQQLLADVNVAATGMEAKIWLGSLEFWGDRGWSYLVLADGKAVSCATAVESGGMISLNNVATLPDQQRRGYAELAVRQALIDARDATGVTSFGLAPRPAGKKLYERLGFNKVGVVHLYELVKADQ